jgi:hypothetical protein
MGPLQTEQGTDHRGISGTWVVFEPNSDAVFVTSDHWVGVDFDGTLSRDDSPEHFLPPYPLGKPIPEMIEMIQSLQKAGITVKIFTARACEPESVPVIQAWTVKHGLGRLEVTNAKDYGLIRFYDDRAIQMVPNQGKSVASHNFEPTSTSAQT